MPSQTAKLIKETTSTKKDKKVKSAPVVVAPVESSSSESSSSESEEEAPVVVVAAPVKKSKKSKIVAAAPVPAPVVESSSSESSSDSETEAPIAAETTTATDKASESGSSSSSDSSSDSEEEEAKEAPMKKQKTETEPVIAEASQDAISSLFIGNLGWGVTIEDLRAVFEEYGTVLDTRIATDPQTGRSRGFGYVDFQTPESAQKGLAASGMDLQGRNMNVDLATSKPKAGGANGRSEDAKTAPADCLFVGNLSFNSSEDSLAEIFGEYGTVTEVRLPTDRETGRKKGFGYIQFGSIEEATAALEALNGQDIDGRSLRCDYSGPRPAPSGDRPAFGGSGRGSSRGRGGFSDRGSRGGRGGSRGGRGGFSDRGSSRGSSRGGASFSGKRTVFE